MYKLTIISGPNKGKVFKLENGERIIGRAPDVEISLASQNVSKRHCALIATDSGITMKDLGSSNGSFVNGMLVKEKKLNSGDRISIGEYVLEVTKVSQAAIQSSQMGSNVIPLRGVPAGTGFTQAAAMAAGNVGVSAVPAIPTDLKGKVVYYFETYVLNFLYNLNETHEWKSIYSFLFIGLVVLGSVFAVYPVLDRTTEKLENEARERALLITRQIVDRNTQFIFEKMDSKVDVSFAEKEKGVNSAYVIDTEGRILAPGRKMNQYLTEANEASFSAQSREIFYKREKLEEYFKVYDNTVMVAVPLRVFSATQGKNVTVALGVVSFDRGMLLFDDGAKALAYIQALILAAIIGVIVYFSTYRLTLRPLEHLNEEVDQVLKGNGSSITKKFKMSEINPLIDIMNSALQRAAGGAASGGGGDSVNADELSNSMKSWIGNISGVGMLIVSASKRIIFINSYMEEITGIRQAVAAGDEISNVARDSAFNSFVDDIVMRAAPGADAVAEDFEFSGTAYHMSCMAVGSIGSPKFYLISASKA